MGVVILALILLVAFCLLLVGTCTECFRYGDREEVSSEEDRDALYEASKFRRIEQYDSVLL